MKKWLKSIFTDNEWDADATKIFGFCIVVAGVVGFFLQKNDFQWLIGFGASLIASGKFTEQG